MSPFSQEFSLHTGPRNIHIRKLSGVETTIWNRRTDFYGRKDESLISGKMKEHPQDFN